MRPLVSKTIGLHSRMQRSSYNRNYRCVPACALALSKAPAAWWAWCLRPVKQSHTYLLAVACRGRCSCGPLPCCAQAQLAQLQPQAALSGGCAEGSGSGTSSGMQHAQGAAPSASELLETLRALSGYQVRSGAHARACNTHTLPAPRLRATNTCVTSGRPCILPAQLWPCNHHHAWSHARHPQACDHGSADAAAPHLEIADALPRQGARTSSSTGTCR